MKDWPEYVASCYVLLKPGGYLELQDTVGGRIAHINKGILPMEPWEEKCTTVTRLQGLDFECGFNLRQYVTAACFEIVSVDEEMLPFGAWLAETRPETEKLGKLMETIAKAIALIFVRRTLEGVESEECIMEYERMADAR